MKCRRLRFVNAELHYGNIGLREDREKEHAYSVREAPALVATDGDWRKQSLYVACERRVTRGRVLDLVEVTWEAPEIMYRSRRGHSSYRSAGKIPVSRDCEHSLGASGGGSDSGPAFRIFIVEQRIHRIAVPEEDGR